MRLRVLNADRRTVGREWHYPGIVSPFARIYLIHDADRATVHHAGAIHQLRPGRLHLIPAFAPGDYRCLGRLDHSYLHVATVVEGGLDLTQVLAMPVDLEASAVHVAGFARAVAAHAQLGESARLIEDAEIRLILADFAAHAGPALLSDPLAAMLPIIESRLSGACPVADLARLSGLHPTWFSARFRQRYGTTPKAWIMARRLERAAWLLRTTSLRIEAIAAAVGMPDRGYFTRQFSRRFGLGPATWRANAQPGDR
jgi:AraC-like DNA-binding protein